MTSSLPEPEQSPEIPSTAAVPPLTSTSMVLTGLLWSGLAHLLPQLYALAQSITAARILGPEGMGAQSYIAWAQLSLTVLFTGGLPVAVTRYVGEAVGAGRRGAVSHLLTWAWRIEAIGAALGAAVLLAVSLTRSELQPAWALAGVACALAIMHTVPNAVLIGLQRFRDASIVGLVVGSVGTGAVIVVLLAGGGITGMFVVEACVAFVSMVWAGFLAKRSVAETPMAGDGPYGDLHRRVLRYAGLASIRVAFALVIWRRSEVFFIERYADEREIAFYSVAFSAFSALSEVPSALLATLFPAFATLYGAGDVERIRAAFGRALRLLTILTLPVLTAVLIAGPRALSLLYGSDYGRTGRVLVVLLCAFPLYVLFKLAGALLQGMDKIRKMFPVDIAATIVDLSLAMTLIPLWGAVGAATANAATQAVAGVLLLVVATRHIGQVSWRLSVLLRTVAICVLVAVPMALGLRLDGAAGLLAALAAGGVVYLALAVRIGVIPGDDARWLDESAGDRFGGLVGRLARLLGEGSAERPAPSS